MQQSEPFSQPGKRTEAEDAYLLGADLAQQGVYDKAVEAMAHALSLDPGLDTARFQLGLLLLTMNQPERSIEVWRDLDQLPDSSPLRTFKQGLEALISDDFPAAITLLRRGLELNTSNAPLNHDMAMLMNKIIDQSTSGPRTDFSLYEDTSRKAE